MIETHLSLFDASVTGIMLLSSVFAFYRGFVREVLSLGAWIGAGIVTIYYFPSVASMLRPHFKSEIGAAGVGTLVIYTCALLAFSMMNVFILKFVKSGSDVGMLDNLLGLTFGALRGAVIISLAFFLYTIAAPTKNLPDTVTKTLTYPYVEKGAVMLAGVAPDYLREISSLEKRAAAEMSPAAGGNSAPVEPEEPEQDKPAADENTGYAPDSTKQLDQILSKSQAKK